MNVFAGKGAVGAGAGGERWSQAFGQIFRVFKWSLCRWRVIHGAARIGDTVGLGERARDDAAEFAKQWPPVGAERPDQLRHGEDVLPVRHGPQHELLDPATPGEDALLVAAGAARPVFGRAPRPHARLAF